MSLYFVIINQANRYWSKQQEWVDHDESVKWVRYEHHDDALNALVEMSVKDPGLRARVKQIDPT
ncbi:MAG: hypothetical protein O2851_02360 [Proteobacteria bacterium]|jgi:hypothetical protein|nr:hypothetical protein [Pseudomonadota bacterium]HBZ48731.1 hypothetical protein [Halieaceae bacterium]